MMPVRLFHLFSVLKQFGKTKQLSEETKNICLQVISMALSSNADSQGKTWTVLFVQMYHVLYWAGLFKASVVQSIVR